MRTAMQTDQAVFRCGDCLIDVANRRFTRKGVERILEPKVFAVIIQLIGRPGELLTRDQLLDSVGGHQYVSPSTLNRVISLARRALTDETEGTPVIQTVHGAGYRYVGPIEPVSVGATEPRARFGPPPSARLPARLQSLIGREQELDLMGKLFTNGRSLTVLGTGGMGKTQCAPAFAHDHADRFPDGIWFFDLVPVRTAQEWLSALAGALSISTTSDADLLQRTAQALAGRRALLLIDNCDRLSSDIGALIVQLLRATDQLTVLATSQKPLNFMGERILRLPPLRLPEIRNPETDADLSELAATPAVSLLLERISDSQTDFKLTAQNASAVADICERLDGMPLALELAAARFSLLSATQVLERLDERFRFLTSSSSGRDHRHQNLIAPLDWSFGLLAPVEQRFLAWLAVFVQGWTVDAATDLAAPFASTAETTVDLLGGLVSKSLVVVDQSLSPPRYRLLESVRDFALEKLHTYGEDPAARDAHMSRIRNMAELAHKDMLTGKMRERIGLLMREHGIIAAACEHALKSGNAAAALRIMGRLTVYFKAHGSWAFGRQYCELALAGALESQSRDRGTALMCRGVAIVMCEKDGAAAPLLEAAAIARQVGDSWTEGYASGWLALWFAHAGRSAEAPAYIATTERAAEALNDGILAGLAGLARGWIHLAQERLDDAIAGLQRVRDVGGDYH